jgi:hypothetical protein
MFPAASLLTILLLALSIAASPFEIRDSPITLPIARRLNVSDGSINLLQHDKARVDSLKKHPQSPPATNVIFYYIAKIDIGKPARTCKFNIEKTCGC